MEKMKPHVIEIGIFFIVILMLSVGTYARNRLWNNEKDLWADCVKKSPHKARPYVNLGMAYLNEGAYDKALEITQKAIQIDPKAANAYQTLSIAFQKMGDLNQAIEMGKKSLEMDPTLYRVYYILGGIYFEKGHYAQPDDIGC